MKNKNWEICALIIGMLFLGCKKEKNLEKFIEEINQNRVVLEDTMFCFLGKGIDISTNQYREENFDKCPYEITEDNIQTLYRKYDVKKIEGTDLYLIEPFQLYSTSQYFTRLLKFDNGKQVAARTFYAWSIPYIFKQGDQYMLALNSLATTSGMNTSSFTCKTELVDKNLNTVRSREYRYPEQAEANYAYSYVDTLYQVPNGYNFRIINTGFDPEDYYQYTGILSTDNIVLESVKKNLKVNY